MPDELPKVTDRHQPSNGCLKNPLRVVPFVQTPASHLLPASYRIDDGETGSVIIVASTAHVKNDLSFERLDKIYGWLWLAGFRTPPRPLSYQRAISRKIIVCEETGLHLAWSHGGIFLKPLPRYLLDEQFWHHHLMQDEHLYGLAMGLLLSYVALIQYESDFSIAKDEHLVPQELTWNEWVGVTAKVLTQAHPVVNRRYRYGELYLPRLNHIFTAHGYCGGYYWELINLSALAPITLATVYIALVLSAMQVGLATRTLGGNDLFQNASYGFAVFSIFSPIALALFLVLLGSIYFCFTSIGTLRSGWQANSITQSLEQAGTA
ncbi:hypothetical protein EDB81DRAFT_861647 [Dactylonectria macrodidyma]|uniref:Uncharacterized protein n=1 Tax=Dactylonectria macrodidyma TaxID=307937 RepID=A0A9P9IH81_9HYPO|nr:hypothetical protein EDB81DRAFT_861647 [Dactylonectria macrodidyma]